jgi:hypothetical protein
MLAEKQRRKCVRRTWYLAGREPLPTGAVLRRDLILHSDGRRQFRRGTPLEELLSQARVPEGLRIPIAVPDAGEIEQHEASLRIARAVAGTGTRFDAPHQGQVTIRAGQFGLVRVDEQGLQRLVRTGAALVATVLDGRVAEEGEVIAIAKAPSLFVRVERLERALAVLAGRSVVHVAPFRRRRVALLAGARVRPAALEVAGRALGQKLARFGARLEEIERLDADDTSVIAQRIAHWVAGGIELVLTAGSIMLDPDDPFLRAVRRLRAERTVHGAPVDPGTMFWVAYRDTVPIFGLASCEMYGRTSVFDLIVPFALADERIDRPLMARLAHGGLLVDTQAARVPPRWRQELETEIE